MNQYLVKANARTPEGRWNHLGLARVNPHNGLNNTRGARVGLYQIFFAYESFVHESIVLSFFRPACIAHTVATLLHDYWAV